MPTIENTIKKQHFLVLGNKETGKTRLTVGIANELAIKKKASSYVTLIKWINLLQQNDEELLKSQYSLWKWDDSDFIVVDDINPGNPQSANKFSANDVKGFILNEFEVRNSHVIKEISMAWVIGELQENDTIDAWIDMLIQMGVEKEEIKILDLNIL